MKSRDKLEGTLGTFELHCLMAVASLGDEAYGANVHELLEDALRRTIPLSQVYLALKRLEDKGMVRSGLGEPEAVRGGRRKRVFTILGAGQRAIKGAERAFAILSPRLAFGTKRVVVVEGPL